MNPWAVRFIVHLAPVGRVGTRTERGAGAWGPHRNLSVFVPLAFKTHTDTMASSPPSKPVSSEDIVTQKVRALSFRISKG